MFTSLKRNAAIIVLPCLLALPGIIILGDTSTRSGMLHAAQKKEGMADRGPRNFALNFKDVDIAEFLNIMGQLTGKNIILDDRVKGKISISSSKKVPIEQAYSIMKSILEVKGLAVVESGNLVKVLPIQDAIKKNAEIVIDGKKKEISAGEDNTLTFLLELKNAEADEVANVLKSLKSRFVDIVVYKSMNMIIFSGTAAEIDGLVRIAKAFDLDDRRGAGVKSAGNIHVVHLEHANAEDLAAVLSRVPFSDSAKIDTSPLKRSSDGSGGSSMGGGNQGTPGMNQGTKDIQPSKREDRVTKRQGSSTAATGKLSIIAYKDTNSLIIHAKPDEFNEILNIIRELDVVREQVLIEAMIVEVSVENGWGLGIDWMLGYKLGDNIIGGSSIMSSNVPNYKVPDAFGTNTKIPVPFGEGFQLGFVNDKNVLGFALLNASATDTNFSILSTPQIVTVDNSEAELNVGEEIGVPTNNRITEQNTTFQTYEYKTVGIKLKITPHITKKQKITLDLYQEVNSIIGETTTTTGTTIPPTLAKRDIKTKVTVNDGKTIVVGGLISNKKNRSEKKVPLLGDIPLLGWFFKHKTVSNKKTNLLVFITPHIVTRVDKLDAITKQKRDVQDRLRKK